MDNPVYPGQEAALSIGRTRGLSLLFLVPRQVLQERTWCPVLELQIRQGGCSRSPGRHPWDETVVKTMGQHGLISRAGAGQLLSLLQALGPGVTGAFCRCRGQRGSRVSALWQLLPRESLSSLLSREGSARPVPRHGGSAWLRALGTPSHTRPREPSPAGPAWEQPHLGQRADDAFEARASC